MQLEYSKEIYPALGLCKPGKVELLPRQSPAEEFAALAHEVAHLCGDGIYVASASVRAENAGIRLESAT